MLINHTIYAILVFLFIILFIYITLYALNKINNYSNFKANTSRRLRVKERVWLDSKRQVVIIQRDHREHVILLSPQQETIIESFETLDC